MARRFVKLGMCVVLAAVVGVGCGSSSSSRPEGGTGDGGGQDRASGHEGGLDGPGDGNGGGEGTPGRTPVRLKTSVSSLMLVEGATAGQTITVSLDRPWGEPIIVTASAANPNVAIVIPETIEFAPQEMGPKEVKIVAALDDNTADDKTTITLFSDETGSASVAVDVDDTDVQAVLISPGRVSLTEGRTESVTVRLNNRPGSTVVVTAASSDATKLGVSPTTLTFNAANFSIPQTLALSALQDDDANQDNVTLTLTSTGNIAPLPLPVEITDDDAVNLDVTPASLTLPERVGTPGTLSVKLTRVPAADVAVTVSASSSTKVTFTPATLTFTPGNAMTPQTVQVTAVPDDDSRDENVTFTFAAAGVPARSAIVTIDDPDTQALQIMPAALTVAEGNTVTFGVRLALNPGSTSNVTVNAFSQNPSKIEVNPPVLMFSSSNFSTPQMVTVRALQDEDLANDMASVTLLASGGDTGNVVVSVTDDDTQAIQLIPPVAGSTFTMQETQATGLASTSPLGVRLAYKPAAPVTVTLASSAAAKLTVTPASVVFTPSNYATVQFVTLTAPHDNDMADENVTITASATGLTDVPLAVQILDTDVQQFDISPTSLAPINEGGPGTGFLVRLIVSPSASVTATLSVGGSTKATVTPSQCVFDQTNFMTGCTVGVTGNGDNDTRDEAVTITIADKAGVITTRTLGVAIRDPDVQALQTMTPTLDVVEGAATTLGIRLAFNPVETVTVNVFSGDTSRIAASPPVLTFTAADYNTPKMVTVQALHDEDVVPDNGTVAGHPRVTVSLGSPAAPSVTVPVSITDDDTQAVMLIPTPAGSTLTMTEGGTSPLAVRLAFRPEAATTVTVTSASNDLTVCPSPPCAATTSTVTFAPLSYSTAQFVTLGAIEDMDVTTDVVNVTGTAPSVMPAPSSMLTVTINDNDVLGFSIPTNLGTKVEPSGTAMPTLKLTNDPGAATIVATIESKDTSAVSVTPTTCTLSTSNWMTGCPLTVTAINDDDALDESASIEISGGALATVSVAIATDDDDTQGLIVSEPTAASIHERGSSNTTTFSVRLNAQPAASAVVAVSIMPSPTDGITVSSATLTFGTNRGTNGWDTAQTVTVTGVSDTDLRTDPFSIRVSGPAELATADQFVNVTEIDDDTQAILLLTATATGACSTVVSDSTPNLGEVIERDPTSRGQFCVRLQYQPLSNTVVNLQASTGPSAISFAGSALPGFLPLSFTTTPGGTEGWDHPRLVSFTAGADDNTESENARVIDLASSGFAATRSVLFNIADRDQQAIIVCDDNSTPEACEASPVSTVSLNENTQKTRYVRLKFAPHAQATESIVVTSSDSTRVSASPGTLTFSTAAAGVGSWRTPQPLTVLSSPDGDAANNAISLTLTTQLTGDASWQAPNKSLTANVTDDDTQAIRFAGLAMGASGVKAIGEGESGAVGLRLDYDPVSSVTVTCAVVSPAGPVSVTSAPLVFTAGSGGNWNVAQDVSIAVAEDDGGNTTSEDVTVTCTATGGSPPVQARSFTVHATDNDT